MDDQLDRVLNLLATSGVEIRPLTSPPPPRVPLALGSWSYGAMESRLSLHIYEFDGQDSLDASLGDLERLAGAAGKDVTFAQNGGYLLALMFDRGVVESDRQLEGAMDRLLAAFSGEVER